MHVARKETVVFCSTHFQYFGTDSVDANAARHIDRSRPYKTIECTIGGSSTGTTRDRITVQYTAGHGEGSAVIHVIETLQHQVNLRQSLVENALHELAAGHLMYRTKMDMADSAHHGINSANLLIHRANVVDVFDIHLYIATGSTNADDFMPIRQGFYCSFANGTGGPDDNYFHHDFLTEACGEPKTICEDDPLLVLS